MLDSASKLFIYCGYEESLIRLVQFRRHLDGFAVRVSDPKDVGVLRRNAAFSEVAVLTEITSGGKRSAPTILSAEYYSNKFAVASLDEWKVLVWGLLKYRKPRK